MRNAGLSWLPIEIRPGMLRMLEFHFTEIAPAHVAVAEEDVASDGIESARVVGPDQQGPGRRGDCPGEIGRWVGIDEYSNKLCFNPCINSAVVSPRSCLILV